MCAIALVDSIGRKCLQLASFFALTIVFLIASVKFHTIRSEYPIIFVSFAHFFVAVSKITTFIIGGEVFFTRYQSVGIQTCAISGTMGAIVSQILMQPVSFTMYPDSTFNFNFHSSPHSCVLRPFHSNNFSQTSTIPCTPSPPPYTVVLPTPPETMRKVRSIGPTKARFMESHQKRHWKGGDSSLYNRSHSHRRVLSFQLASSVETIVPETQPQKRSPELRGHRQLYPVAISKTSSFMREKRARRRSKVPKRDRCSENG